jgi:hypothetical protein
MNLPPNLHLSRTDRSIGGVLSAVGSLLMALGGERGAPTPPPADATEEFPPPMVLPSSAIPPTRARAEASSMPSPDPHFGAAEPIDDVSLLLADARARAQAIMDESMARAEELLRPPAETADQQALERIRRTVSDIATDVRAIHSRLDEIEALVRAQSTARAPLQAPPPAYATPPAPPVYTAPPEPPAFGSTQISTPAPVSISTPASVPPPPLLPTSWAGLPSPPPAATPWTSPPASSSSPAVSTPTVDEPAAVVDTFDPTAGAVSLRVSPVAGFQGLMRIQDALVRIRGVREAGVEAYAQGEARLRLHLSASMEASALAAALTELLGRPTRVVAASTAERTLQLVLE